MAANQDSVDARDADHVKEKVGGPCDHCGLPVPRGLWVDDADLQFCCNGCKTVYEVIHSCGLDPYYTIRERAESGGGVDKQKAATSGRKYREFDDETFYELYCQRLGEEGSERFAIDLYLEGVHCAACVWLIEKLPLVCDGVLEARLHLGKSLVRVTWDRSVVALSKIARMLDSLGYAAHPAQGSETQLLRTREDHKFLIRIGAAAVCAGNTMLIAFALYAGMFSWMADEHRELFRWLSMFIGVVALLWPGQIFLKGAWAAIRMRTPHLDLPIAVALVAGTVTGIIHTMLGQGEIYFDSLSVLILLLLVGRWFQHRQQRQADDAVQLLFSLTPRRARLVMTENESDLERVFDSGHGVVREVPIEGINAGDVVEVLAGEVFSVDGDVCAGRSSVNEAILTGESRMRDLLVDDHVCAGTVNESAKVWVKVRQAGEGTRLGKLMQFVERFAREKSPSVAMADRIAGWFVVVVIILASMTWLGWFLIDRGMATEHAIALLIVACPCALGLATPLTIASSIGKAARSDILVKGGSALENLSKPGRIYLDKTGTITKGQTTLRECYVDSVCDDPVWLKAAVLVIEERSSHHVAKAFVEAFNGHESLVDRSYDLRVGDVEQMANGGIVAEIDGREIVIGSLRFSNDRRINLGKKVLSEAETVVSDGLTCVVISLDGQGVGVAGFGDAVRDDSHKAIKALEKLGWQIGILSGDSQEIAEEVAVHVGLQGRDIYGGMSPEEKLAVINETKELGQMTVMVGDGVNDAAALAAADIGIAVNGGAEASLSAADVYLARPGLGGIVELMGLSRRTVRVIRRNLGFSLSYNVITVMLAMLGLINPLIAAVLMPISSLTVITMAVGGVWVGKNKHGL
ncbi:heavy metal translocating P-type ATPase [Poriferisphaera corsica]|uniref:heavy metal translocating P-type ATPase n=1 Tax=Poriferisphaera corsica TaxID=2528020 RepID=UPI00190B0AA0|nr:heavy metal translocating P-type ATPase [Poriferisphaera corsica]